MQPKLKPFASYAYHKTCPEGFRFTDEEEYKNALADGWVESPALVESDKLAEEPKKRGRPPNWQRQEQPET